MLDKTGQCSLSQQEQEPSWEAPLDKRRESWTHWTCGPDLEAVGGLPNPPRHPLCPSSHHGAECPRCAPSAPG